MDLKVGDLVYHKARSKYHRMVVTHVSDDQTRGSFWFRTSEPFRYRITCRYYTPNIRTSSGRREGYISELFWDFELEKVRA